MKSRTLLAYSLLSALSGPSAWSAAAPFSAPSLAGCEVLRFEVRSDQATFAGSAIPIQVGGVNVLVSADHVIPFDLTAEKLRTLRLTVTRTGGGSVSVDVLRRDWASDLLILGYRTANDSRSVKPCALATGRLEPNVPLKMVGYPFTSGELTRRDSQLVDAVNLEIRVARPIPIIKVAGIADKGMSGGALLSDRSEFLGMLIQDWVNENHPLQGGAYALPAQFVLEQAARLLGQSGEGTSDLEGPLPFVISRDYQEMEAFGFRFRQIELATPADKSGIGGGHPDGIGGGHPDGIGGQVRALTALQVMGMTGDTIPPALRPMERMLRRIVSEGNGRVLVVRTEEGRSVRSLVELGRAILIGQGVPRLEFVIKQPARSSGAEDITIEKLTDDLIIQAFKLVDVDASLNGLVQDLRRLYASGIDADPVGTARSILGEIQKRETELFRVSDKGGWRVLIDFSVVRMRLSDRLALLP